MSQLFDRHIMTSSDKMYRYALSILKDDDYARDVVQECLIKIWNKRHVLSEIQNLEAWAMRITRNQCLDWVKGNRFTRLSDLEVNREEDISADHNMLVKDQQRWLNEVLATLPNLQKEIFHLREIEGMSYHEITEVLSISMNEVKVYLHRARNKVRTTLEKIESYGVAN